MKTSDTRAFVNQVILGLLVTIGFGGSIGVATVWMRHQISVVADTNAALEKEHERVARRLADTSALVEAAMNLDVLRTQNERMRLGLVELTQQQIQPVIEDPVRRLVARANRRGIEREAASAGVGIQLPIASGAAAATIALPGAPATPTFQPAPASGSTAKRSWNSLHLAIGQ